MTGVNGQHIGLLIAASRPVGPGASAGFAPADLDGFSDWTDLIALALAHGMGGPLCHHLLATPGNLVPPDIADAARAHIAFLRSAYDTGIAELLDLLAVLGNAGIRAVPFKGPVLARQFHPDPALRRFTDLDMLIPEADAGAAHAALVAHGYRSQHQDLRARHQHAYWRYNGQDVLHAPGRLPVEPHWLFGQRTLATRLDMAAMLSRTIPVTLGGQQVPALRPEDSLIAACFHGSKDEWQSLRTIADVAAILQHDPGPDGDPDWDRMRAIAAAGGIWRMVLIGLQLARTVLGAKLPTALARQVDADRAAVALAAQAASRLFHADGAVRSVFELSAFRWRMRERPADRVRYAGATLLTPRVRQFRSIDLPDALCFLYPVVKVMQDFVALPLKDRLFRARVS